MEEIKYKTVEYLDEPERVLFFTMDEFLAFVIPVGLGLGFHHPSIGLIIGIFAVYLMGRFKANDGESLMQRVLYWYFPLKMGRLKQIPPSYLREFIG